MSNRNYRNNRGHQDKRKAYEPPSGPANVVTRPKRDEHPDRMIKRFMKKVKKEKVIEIYRSKTDYYEKPSVVRNREKKRRKNVLRKLRESSSNN